MGIENSQKMKYKCLKHVLEVKKKVESQKGSKTTSKIIKHNFPLSNWQRFSQS